MPTARADVVNVATPPLSVPVPMGLPLSRNVTVPVDVPAPGATADTVAVNVTICPKEDGLTEDETLVELPSLFTVWASEGLVLPVKFPSPP